MTPIFDSLRNFKPTFRSFQPAPRRHEPAAATFPSALLTRQELRRLVLDMVD